MCQVVQEVTTARKAINTVNTKSLHCVILEVVISARNLGLTSPVAYLETLTLIVRLEMQIAPLLTLGYIQRNIK